jgi:hypothetical protein
MSEHNAEYYEVQFRERRLAEERSGFRVVDQHGEPCGMAGHDDGCTGNAGGEHELLPGWIAYDDEDGLRIEIEVAP